MSEWNDFETVAAVAFYAIVACGVVWAIVAIFF